MILLTAWGLSRHKNAISWRLVINGLALQLLLGVLVLQVPAGQQLFSALGAGIEHLLAFADKGAAFVLGAPIAQPATMEKLFGPGGSFILAVKLISTLILVASLVSMAYYLGWLQGVVKALAKGVNYLLGVSGAEALSNCASVFVGQVEAQLLVKPYLAKMTESELLAVMAGSMACISGGTMAVYIGMGVPAYYLLSASLMAIPGALVISKLVIPETKKPLTQGNIQLHAQEKAVNLLEAASHGAFEGWTIGVHVVVMLIAFISLLAMADAALGGVGNVLVKLGVPQTLLGVDLTHLTLKTLLGSVFYWVALALGIPAKEAGFAGGLLGTKLVVNEFVAYADLVPALKAGLVSPKAAAIISFALCGFANLGSVAIQLGGIGTMAPNRKGDLARLGLLAMGCGTMASYLSAAVAGVLVSLPFAASGGSVGSGLSLPSALIISACLLIILISNRVFAPSAPSALSGVAQPGFWPLKRSLFGAVGPACKRVVPLAIANLNAEKSVLLSKWDKAPAHELSSSQTL